MPDLIYSNFYVSIYLRFIDFTRCSIITLRIVLDIRRVKERVLTRSPNKVFNYFHCDPKYSGCVRSVIL
jgi:hypothetical protein